MVGAQGVAAEHEVKLARKRHDVANNEGLQVAH